MVIFLMYIHVEVVNVRQWSKHTIIFFVHPYFIVATCPLLRYIPTHKYVQSTDWIIGLTDSSVIVTTMLSSLIRGQCGTTLSFASSHITIILNSFSWFINLLWFFLVNRCLHFSCLHLIFNKFGWFQFVNINEHGIRFKVSEYHY
jgi:hypothetical protein